MSVSMAARQRACVVGGLLADAATTPVHWVYDVEKLHKALEEEHAADAPEFFPKSQCPFYEATVGNLSPYGGEYVALLEGLAKTHAKPGAVDPKAIEKEMCAFLAKWAGYKNKSIKTLEANISKGLSFPEAADKKDNQDNGMVKAPLIAAVFAKDPDFNQTARTIVSLTQSRESAVQYGLASSIIMKRVLEGVSIPDAIHAARSSDHVPEDIKKDIDDVIANKDKDMHELGRSWGISCSYPGAFKLALLVALRSSSYVDAVRTNLKLGGDNCSRSVFIGGLFGAADPQSVPEQEWTPRVTAAGAMLTHIDTILLPSQ